VLPFLTRGTPLTKEPHLLGTVSAAPNNKPFFVKNIAVFIPPCCLIIIKKKESNFLFSKKIGERMVFGFVVVVVLCRTKGFKEGLYIYLQFFFFLVSKYQNILLTL
jgi:hypothetical protein